MNRFAPAPIGPAGSVKAARWVLRHHRRLALLLVVGTLAAVVWAVRWRYLSFGSGVSAVVVVLVATAFLAAWAAWMHERVVREDALPQFLKRKLRETYPHLSQKDADLAERGLRQFFLACLRSRGQFVAMPSKAVDVMWHEFILHTQAYRDWCGLALGRFLHHTPAEALGAQAKRNDGLRRAWYWSCRDEAINPRQPTRLPLLFAIDGKLAIPGGYAYVPDCRGENTNGAVYCGTSFSDDSAAGDADGFGGSDSSGGDGGGDGGGCGGGGD